MRPLAGDFALVLFSAGIVGTGLLAVPILAGSSAYAVAEAFNWRTGLGLKLLQARGFYTIVIIASILGVALNFTAIDPIKALFWSADINGVISIPIMVVMMMISVRADIMGPFVVTRGLTILGWLATASMTVVVLARYITWK